MPLLPIIAFVAFYKLANSALKKNTKQEYKIDDFVKILEEEDYIDFIAIDVETTGLELNDCELIEVSAVKYSGNKIVSYFTSLIDPGIKIPKKITELTGINDKDLEGKPSMEQVLPFLSEYLESVDLLGHNIDFDIGFIDKYFDNKKLNNHSKIDTLALSRRIFYDLPSRSLSNVCKHLNIKVDHHRSLEDARAAAEIYLYYLSELQDYYSERLGKLSPQEKLIQNYLHSYFSSKKLNRTRVFLDRTGPYLDFIYLLGSDLQTYNFLRFKLDGDIQYLLVDLNFEDFTDLFPDIKNIDRANKAEGERTRIMLDFEGDFSYLDQVLDWILQDIEEKSLS